jgi:hypothetical protein
MSKHPPWEIILEKLHTLKTIYAYAFTSIPEDDAWTKIETWAKPKGLLTKEKGTRVFGRNTYPTDNPEPHGYVLHITVDKSITPNGELMDGEILVDFMLYLNQLQ